MNISTSEHEGADFSVRYALPRLPIGSLVFNSEWAYLSRSESTFAPANLAPTISDGLYAGGAAKWRSTTSVNWRQGSWSTSLAAYHSGKTHDSGATTTKAAYESLGQPSYIEPFYTGGQTAYRRVIDPVWSYNATIGYNFGPEATPLLRDTRVRLGIVNLTDKEPPLASAAGFGYDPSIHQHLLAGRTWTIEFTRQF